MHVHDDVAQLEKRFGRKRFCKEIRQVVRGVDVLYLYDMVFNELAYVEMTPVNVLGPVVEFRIVGEIYSCCVVNVHLCWFCLLEA